MIRSRRRKPEYKKVSEVKRRARRQVGSPPATRVADRQAKRRRQAERPKHKVNLVRRPEPND